MSFLSALAAYCLRQALSCERTQLKPQTTTDVLLLFAISSTVQLAFAFIIIILCKMPSENTHFLWVEGPGVGER